MKLLYVHESLGSLGGAEANVFITATEMSKRGHDVALLTQKATGKNEDAWRELFPKIYGDGEAVEIAAALGDYQPDVIYVHKWAVLDSLQELLESGIPCIRMVHDHDIYCMRSYRYHPLTREVCRKPVGLHCIFPCGANLKVNRSKKIPFDWVSYFDKHREVALNRKFDRMLVVTRYMQEELETNGFDSNKIEIFPPVPRPGDSLRSSFSDRNLILFAGQIIRGKGVDLLIEALAKMEESFECVILGHGNHQAKCEALVKKLGLEDRVSFPGFIPQEQLKEYYKEATAVAIPSVWPEPIATIGLEVSRYALPMVAFDAGGIPDYLRDGQNGYLIAWADTQGYADALDKLLKDKEKARAMGEKAYEIVSQEYDFHHYLDRLDDLFMRATKEWKGIPLPNSLPPAGTDGTDYADKEVMKEVIHHE